MQTFHDLAYEFTGPLQMTLEDMFILDIVWVITKKILLMGYELIATISDHGLINSKIPEHKKIIKAEERKQKKIEEKLKKDPKNRMLYLNKKHKYYREDIHSIFASMSLENACLV